VNPHLWWYVARATGIVAWALLTTSVVTGLLLSARLTRRRPTPAWVLDLHRFLAGTAVAATGLHLVGLVSDGYVHFGAVELLVPFASAWRPGAVTLGVVALYLVAAVEISSVLMRRLPRRLWRRIHLSSFVAFWMATFHFISAGRDARHPAARVGIVLVIALVVFLTLVRVLDERAGRRARA
jgi:predicted ferric reductase